MTDTRKDGGSAFPDSCAWCQDAPHIKQGRIFLCAKHYRISSMRSRAKRDGKTVPTLAEVEAIIPSPFVCIGCDGVMSWVGGPASKKATLQHDRSGRLRIICLGCNTRHAAHPGDTFYDIPAGHKFCPDCSEVLPLSNFARDRSRPIGRKSYCRPCASFRFKKWSSTNAVS